MTTPRRTATANHADADDLPLSATARTRLGLALFALLAYVPLMLTDVGKVEADSKVYFYLDPGRLLAGAASMWDPSIAMGTVSYQTLGYLFPIGPFYWILEHLLGLPPWIAERLWLGTLIFAAGLGTRFLLRTLGARGPGIAVGMLAYAFTPYAIQFSARTSVLLGPWVATPWMAALIVLALRRGGWKYPALLAITVQLSGSVNASTLIFALLAPTLFILFSVFVVRETEWRRALSVVWRSGALVLVTSLWWMSALLISSGYGRNVLRFTETIKTTSSTTFPIEVVRGVGYWFFYGKDARGLWVSAAMSFTRNPTVVFASLLLPALALLAAVAVRWRYRLYFVMLVLVGVIIAVGSSPYSHPSPIGAAFKAFASGNTVGLALRNSGRAVPLVALGLASLLAVAVSALHARLADRGKTRAGIIVALLVGALCLVNAPGVWGGAYYSTYLEWRSVPKYWHQAASSLDTSHDTRVLALPGSPFSAYTWGALEDPVEPGLMSRPFVTREQIPEGSEATANLLQAVDGRLQSNLLDPNAVAPVARLMGVGDVLLDMDLQTDRYGLIPADLMWNTFTERPPTGLGAPETFGTKIPGPKIIEPGNVARPPLPSPPPLAVLPVEQPLNILRTKSAADPIVVDGDGEGLVDTASVGQLDARRLVLYSPSYEKHPSVLRGLTPAAALVVTDTNRRRPHSTQLINSYGPTEQAGERPLVKSPYDQRFDVFPDATSKSQTVLIMHGVKSVQATFGDQPFTPGAVRPSLTLDGDVKTGWLVDGSVHVGPERLRIQFDKPITTDHINLVQPLKASQGRWITGVILRFDGKSNVRRGLDDSSRTKSGQTLQFPTRTFSTLEIQIDHVHHQKSGAPENAVGFQEIGVADNAPGSQPVRIQETTRLPVDLLDALGRSSNDHPLTFVLSRDQMDDLSMSRVFSLPTARTFTLSGTAELGTLARDDAIDSRLGLPSAAKGGITSVSLARYGDPIARSSSAFDGDPATAWTTPLGAGRGWMRMWLPKPISFDHMDLRFVNDGRHSIPTRMKIDSDDGSKRVIDVGAAPHTPGPDHTVSVPVHFDTITGHRFTFTIVDIKPKLIRTSEKQKGLLMPSGIAELGIPGVVRKPIPAQLPSACINDLLTIDGKPFPVRVEGSTADALQPRLLSIQPCNPNDTLKLAAGNHEIRGAESPHSPSGLDVEHLVLTSGAGGAAPPPAATSDAAEVSAAPAMRVVHNGRSSMTLHVDAASKPFWLVLGQSLNRGWVAKADGHDLGKPSLVDGYANGWLVNPTGHAMTITLNWAPQRIVWIALPLSALGLLLCLGIVAGALVRDRRRRLVMLPVGAPPVLRRSSMPRPLARRRGAIIGTVVAMGAAAALFVTPLIGVLVAVLVLLAILRPRWHRALRFAPAAIVGAIAIYITLAQILRNYQTVIQWPSYFDPARIPTWVAMLLLAADGVIAMVWHTELDDGEPDGDPDTPSS